MEKEELKILEELRRILNSKNEAIVILNNYFKGGVGKSKLSTMFAYLTDKFNLNSSSANQTTPFLSETRWKRLRFLSR